MSEERKAWSIVDGMKIIPVVIGMLTERRPFEVAPHATDPNKFLIATSAAHVERLARFIKLADDFPPGGAE